MFQVISSTSSRDGSELVIPTLEFFNCSFSLHVCEVHALDAFPCHVSFIIVKTLVIEPLRLFKHRQTPRGVRLVQSGIVFSKRVKRYSPQ